MRIILAFLGGLMIGFLEFQLLLPVFKPQSIQVLAQTIEVTPIPTATPIPTVESTFTPEPTSTPKPTPPITPKPTVKPTPNSTSQAVVVPTATPDVWSPPHLENWFSQYAGQFGVDKNTLERIANCESHFNPNAKNGDYVGMFQFNTSTWRTYRNQLGLDPNPDLRTNAEESIKTGAFLISKRGTAPWPSCL